MRIIFCSCLLLLVAVSTLIAQGTIEFSDSIDPKETSDKQVVPEKKSPSIMLAVQAGMAQSFFDMTGDVILSSQGKLSPVFSLSVFRAKPGFGFHTGVSLTTHFFEVETNSSSDRNFKLMYIDLPAMARYNFSPSFSLSAGVSIAFNIAAKADFDFSTGRPESGMKKISDTAQTIIGNMKICTSYRFPMGLTIHAGYSTAAGEILKDGTQGKQFGYVDVQIGYILFGNSTSYRANDRLRNAGPVNK